jgi:hypothetical protein
MKAIVMNGTGGREMLEYVERPDPVAGPGQALVEIAFAGVNFMDIGVRQGTVWNEMPNPKILGVEGVGRVVAAGDGVEGLAPGQRVAWVYVPGSYAERIAIPATSLVPVPDAIDDRTAASVMMQGLTASHFATDFYPVQPGGYGEGPCRHGEPQDHRQAAARPVSATGQEICYVVIQAKGLSFSKILGKNRLAQRAPRLLCQLEWRHRHGQFSRPFRLVRADDDGHENRQDLLRQCRGLGRPRRLRARFGL